MTCSECQRSNGQRPHLKHWIVLGVAVLVTAFVLIAEREKRGKDQDGDLRVDVGSEGFEPGSLRLPDGVLTTVTFRRTSEAACAHALVFPELNVERELPLGQDVTIDVPASAPRRLGFQCGAGPYRGKLLIN
jgi:plastocyanin domain-containing protein